jgi:putative (di)nucleoside polyphosphate hydrolase
MSQSHKRLFRANVAALLRVGTQVVACERAAGDGWQTVQGGVEPTDVSLEAALLRELAEELGLSCKNVNILHRSSYWRRYYFPPEVLRKRPDNPNLGQDQMWFFAELESLRHIQLEASDGEFRSFCLMSPEELVERYVDWKRPCVLDFCRELNVLP